MVVIKAVVFDLDGTLLDTIEDVADAMNEVLSWAGDPVHPVSAYKHFVGAGLNGLVSQSLPVEKRTQENIREYLEKMRQSYSLHYDKKTKPYSGIPELLNELVNNNISIAVLSNKFDEFTKIMVKNFFPDFPFGVVLGARANIPHKPDPLSALEIAGQLQLQPSEIIMIGDSGVDMLTAHNAGFFSAGALWGYKPESELMVQGAQFLLKVPADLLSAIININNKDG